MISNAPLSSLETFNLEAKAFRELVADASPQQWELMTPAEPWKIRDQVAHLTFVFQLATMAASDADMFAEATSGIGRQGAFDAAVNAALAPFQACTAEVLLDKYVQAWSEVDDALAQHDPTDVLPWLVNPIPAQVLALAGTAELFAHGQDVADTLGVTITRTDTVGHIAGFIHRTRDFGYQARGLVAPSDEFRFELELPSGRSLTLGPEDTNNVVSGPAEDLCLLATRRRHRLDLDLVAQGALADEWLDIAQAYRGPAGSGRQPLKARQKLSA